MAINLTPEVLDAAYPEASDILCKKRAMVEAKIAHALTIVDEDVYGERAQLVAELTVMDMIAKSCGQVDDEGCSRYEKDLKRYSVAFGCRLARA